MEGLAINQTALLNAIGHHGAADIDLLDASLELRRHEIIKAVGKMIVSGYVQRLERGVYALTDFGTRTYLLKEGIRRGPQAPATGQRSANKTPSLRQKAWNVMRMGEPFDIESLAMVAANEDVAAPVNNLQRYVRVLVQADYCNMMPTVRRGTRPGSNGHRRYRLVKNTGPIAPVHKSRAKPPCIYDHNLGRAVPCKLTA